MGEIIITVHGTGDSEVFPVVGGVKQGRWKWWEPGSPFEQELLPYLGPEFDDAHFEPFIWSGANSERDRREAAKELLSRLKDHEKAGDTYHIIGHSHGGSLTAEATWRAARRSNALPGLQSITSVAMPLIEFAHVRMSTEFMARGFYGAPWLLLVQIPLLLLAVGWWVMSIRIAKTVGDGMEAQGAAGSALILLFAAIAVVRVPYIIYLLNFSKAWRFSNGRLKKAKRQFGSKWQPIWHGTDEVIKGLKAAPLIHLPVFEGIELSAFVKGIANVFAFFGVITIICWAIWGIGLIVVIVFASGATSLPAWLPGAMKSQAFGLGIGIGGLVLLLAASILVSKRMPAVARSLFYAAALLMVLTAIWQVLQFYGDGLIHSVGLSEVRSYLDVRFAFSGKAYGKYFLGIPIAALLLFGAGALVRFVSYLIRVSNLDTPVRNTVGRGLDRAVEGQLRTNAYGSNVGGEHVVTVVNQPPFVPVRWRSLPEPTHSDMLEFVNRGAAETLSKLRDMIGTIHVSDSKLDLVGELTSRLSWHELIHTTYWYDKHLPKLMAYGMLKLAGRPPSEKLKADPDFPEIEKWHAHMSGEGPALAEAR